MKKFLSIILAILMIVTTVPMAFSAEGDTGVIYVDSYYSYSVLGDVDGGTIPEKVDYHEAAIKT